MKKTLLLALATIFYSLISCSQTPKPLIVQKEDVAVEFETTEHDLEPFLRKEMGLMNLLLEIQEKSH